MQCRTHMLVKQSDTCIKVAMNTSTIHHQTGNISCAHHLKDTVFFWNDAQLQKLLAEKKNIIWCISVNRSWFSFFYIPNALQHAHHLSADTMDLHAPLIRKQPILGMSVQIRREKDVHELKNIIIKKVVQGFFAGAEIL